MSRPIASESIFRAIADPKRRRVLELLRKSELSPGEISAVLRLATTTLSFHLRVLMNSGLVSQRRRGRQRIYCLTPRGLREAANWLNEHERSLATAARASG